MTFTKLIFTFIIVTIIFGIVQAEEFTFDRFPSVEELYEAYLRGDIEYETYLNLAEIIEDGVDSTEIYLFEEIPNLSYFTGVDPDSLIWSDSSSSMPFVSSDYSISTTGASRKNGYVRLRGYQEIDENAASRRDLRVKMEMTDQWSTELRIEEDYAGRKEIARRSLIYKAYRGQVKRMVIGSYTARFGLGLTVGYRGKLLDKSEYSTAETIAFPDYGGYNGVYIEGGRESDGMKFMAHYDRNDQFAFKTAALNLIRHAGYFDFEFIGLGSFIDNREVGIEYKHYQFGGYARYAKYNFSTALEIAHAKEATNIIPAALFETTYRTKAIKLEFSGWRYGDDYINIAGGGRAGSFYQTVVIDTLDLDYRDKRADQTGALFKSRAQYMENAELFASITYYGPSKYENNYRMLLSSVHSLNIEHEIKLGYRHDRRERLDGFTTENEYRVEHKYSARNLGFRSYIGYHDDDDGSEYISLFNKTSVDIGSFGVFELWCNLDKLNIDTKQNDYFYCYLKESFKLNSTVDIAVKYSYRYSRNYYEKERSLVLLEAVGRW